MKKLCILLIPLLLCSCVAGVPSSPSADPTPTLAPIQTQQPESTLINWFAVGAKEYLSLRTAPDSGAERIKKLSPGAMVKLLSQEGDFALVEDSLGETGYVLMSYLIPAHEYTPEAAATPTPIEAGMYLVDAEEYISLRTAPDVKAERIRKLMVDTQVEVLSIHGDFALVRESGEEGYVLHRYLSKPKQDQAITPPAQIITPAGDIRIVAAENYLSLRTAPDGEAERIAKLYPGTVVLLVDAEDNGFVYVQEQDTGEMGYVLAKRLVTREQYAALPSATATPQVQETPAPAQNAIYKVKAQEYISLRKSPSTSAERVAKISAGDEVTLLAFDGKYAQVKTADGQSGYVLSGYLAPKEKDRTLSSLTTAELSENYTHSQMKKDLNALAKEFPKSLRIEEIGTSINGKTILVARLGNPDAERHVLVHAGIHGREHMTSLLLMKQLEYCLRNPDNAQVGASISSLLDDVCLHIIPMINPDGITISQSGKGNDTTKAIYQADLAGGLVDVSYEEYLSLWKANAKGVDINRNFNAGWHELGGRSAPSYSHYKGKSPHDQPETKALADYTKRYNFDATISYHAFGSCLYWQYGSDQRVNDQSNSLAKAIRKQTQYPLSSSGGLDAGGYKDWAMDVRSIPSVTVEIGTRECPLPMDEFATIWQRNRLVLPAVAAWVR